MKKTKTIKGYAIVMYGNGIPYIQEREFKSLKEKSATSEISLSKDTIICRSIYKDVGTKIYYRKRKDAETNLRLQISGMKTALYIKLKKLEDSFVQSLMRTHLDL